MSRNLRDGRRARGRRRGVRRGRGGECQAASGAGQLSVPDRELASCRWTPWRTAAVVSCASARVVHLGRRTALSLFSYLTPHTRRVLGGGFCVERTDRRLHACACEGADENSWQSRQRHTPAASSAHWYSSVWPGQQRHPIMVKALRRRQRHDRVRHFLLSCSRAAAT